MSKRTVAQLISLTNNVIKTNGNEEITGAKDNALRKEVIDSFLNLKDGGLVVEAESGYSSAITPTTDYSWATKKYVDDAASGTSITLTTIGTSGAATLVGTTLNIPQYAGTTYTASDGVILTGNDFSFDYSVLSASGPLSYNSGTGGFSISQANGSTDGYLSSTDWDAFNGKQSAFTAQAANLVYRSGDAGGIPSFSALSLSDMPVFSGYVAGSNYQTITSADKAFTAIQKLDGNIDVASGRNVGSIYNEAFSGSISTNYTIPGGTATYSYSAGTMLLSGGNNTLVQPLVLKNFLSASDKFEIVARYTIGDVNTAGVGFGIESISPFIVWLDTDVSSASVLKVYAGLTSYSVVPTTTKTIAVASGDNIEIYVQQNIDVISALVVNKTTGATIPFEYVLTNGQTGINDNSYRVGSPAIYEIEGNHTVTYFEVLDRNLYRPDYIFIVDSIGCSYYAGNKEYSYIDQLIKAGYSVVRMGMPSATAGEYNVASFINYINKINPKLGVINWVGTNDVTTLGAATAITNYNGLVTKEKSAGYSVIHVTALDRTGQTTNINTFNASIKSTYPTDVIVDMNSVVGLANASNALYTSDLIHLSVAGNEVAKNVLSKYLTSKENASASRFTIRTQSKVSLPLLRSTTSATITTGSNAIGLTSPNGFPYKGLFHLFNGVSLSSEIVQANERNATQINGVVRGLYGTSAISSSGATDITVSSITELKTATDNTIPYYIEFAGPNNLAGFIWGRSGQFSTTDQYILNGTTRFSSDSDLNLNFTKSQASKFTLLRFQSYIGGAIFNNFDLLHDINNNFNLMAGSSTAWGSDATGRITLCGNNPTYRLLNAGADIQASAFIDPARNLTAGFGHAFDATNGHVFTLGNGTRRIGVASINLINTSNTAGSETGDLGVYAKSTTLSNELSAWFSRRNANLNIVEGTATVAPLMFAGANLIPTAASGTGSVATLTFAAQSVAPFRVGSLIYPTGITPSGYNAPAGAIVTSVTTTTVSYASLGTGALTVAGVINQGVLTTSPIKGAMEYDGSKFYATPGSVRNEIVLNGPNGILLGTAGQGVQIKGGTNSRIGTGTLASGTVTISNTSITANTRIFCFASSSGIITNPLRETARVVGTSFTVGTGNPTDTASFSWYLIEEV